MKDPDIENTVSEKAPLLNLILTFEIFNEHRLYAVFL